LATHQVDHFLPCNLGTGGHAFGHQPTGAAKGGGEAGGKPAKERRLCWTPKKQVFESEGREGERLFLFFIPYENSN